MDPNTIQERYNDTPQPMLKSEMDVLLDRGIRLRQYINTLVEKRGALRPTALIKSDDIDDVEFAQMQEDEEERIAKLLKRYNETILEKEKELEGVQHQVKELKKLKRSIEDRIRDLKRGIIDSELTLVADARIKSERELAMHNAVLNDNPTNVQRIFAKRGKLLSETQIRGQIQKEADLRMVIPELEARLAMLNGDFDLQRRLQQQLEKQRGQLQQQLKKQQSNGDDADEQPKFVEFLQPWGGYREGNFQLVASLGEEVAADLVDAKVVQYVAPVKATNEQS